MRSARIAAVLAPCLIGVSAFVVSPALADQDPYDGGWHFSLTPYVWVPGISGDLKFKIPPGASGSPQVHAGPADVLGFLNFAFMGAVGARKGNWSVFSDFIYLDLSGDKASVKNIRGPGGNVEIPVNANTELGLRGIVWTSAIGYSLYHSDTSSAPIRDRKAHV